MADRRFSTKQLQKLLETSQGKSYAVTAVTVLLVVFLVLGGVFPAISAILFQVSENQNRAEAADQVEEKRVTLRALVDEEQTKKTVSNSLNHYLPDGTAQESIYTLLNTILAQTRVNLLSVNFGEIDESRSLIRTFKVGPQLAAKTVTFSITGNRTALESFMGLLETSRRIINVISFSEFNYGESNDGIFRMEIMAEFYYWEA